MTLVTHVSRDAAMLLSSWVICQNKAESPVDLRSFSRTMVSDLSLVTAWRLCRHAGPLCGFIRRVMRSHQSLGVLARGSEALDCRRWTSVSQIGRRPPGPGRPITQNSRPCAESCNLPPQAV